MERALDVRTHERIALSYDLAGLGTRFLAVLLDLFVQIAILAAILWALSLLAGSGGRSESAAHHLTTLGESITIAVIVAILFAVFFGYFIVFEAFWNGRTLGKRALGIRVVRDGGYALDFGSAAIRNLVRVGEVALGLYAVSALSCLLSSENKRLGDFAAGTIVVRESRLERWMSAGYEAPEADAGDTADALTPQERAVVDRYLARRNSLAPRVRSELAARIAARVRSRAPSALRELADDELLERL